MLAMETGVQLLLLYAHVAASVAAPDVALRSSPVWDVVTTFGNHRFAIPVPTNAAAAIAFTAEIEWRRTGNSSAVSAGLVLFCAGAECATTTPPNAGLLNATVLNSSRVSAFVAIDARALAPGSTVYAYYMPFSRNPGSAFGEQVSYLTNADRTASTASSLVWRHELNGALAAGVPHVDASASKYEARTQFDAYTELERTATEAEISGMLASSVATKMGDVLVFPEPRERQIRMTWRHPQSPTLPDLPHCWTVRGPSLSLNAGRFDKGEFATFQLGLFAAKAALARVDLDLGIGAAGFATTLDGAGIIPESALNCFNLAGVDDQGQAFNRSYSIPHLQTGALWFGLDIPSTVPSGQYNGSIGLLLTSATGELTRHTVSISFEVTSAAAYRSGDRNLTKLSRTRWVNSRIGETDVPAKRHSALIVDKSQRTVQTWSMLVTLSESGLPAQLTRIGVTRPVELLSGPFEFAVDGKASCEALTWMNTAAIASWTGRCTGAGAQSGVVQIVKGRLDADGTIVYDVTLTAASADQTSPLEDVQLVLPMANEAVPYSMGLGRQGDRLVDWDWRWWTGQTEPQSAPDWGPKPMTTGYFSSYQIWVGDVDQGMRFKLLGDGDNWLSALHSASGAVPFPSWSGVPVPPSPSPTPVGGMTCGGNCKVYSGGVRIRKGGVSTNITAFRGAKTTLSSTTGLSFKFELLLTPCVRLNTSRHFGDSGRYFQYSHSNQLPGNPPTSAPTLLAKEFLESGVKVRLLLANPCVCSTR